MTTQNYPKYIAAKHKGNIGEAIAQYFLAKFCLVHKIDGSNDLGNDFICELIKNQAPTNLLFYVQVKFTREKPRISKSTLAYWKGSPIPVYIIWIQENGGSVPSDPERMNGRIKYLRMTPTLHDLSRHAQEGFKPYSEIDFKRDLIIDYTRVQYEKGFTPIVEPRDYLTIDEKNIAGIGRYTLYIRDVIPEYADQILKRAWVQPYTVAALLFQQDTVTSNLNALRAINLALSLIRTEDRDRLSEFFNEMNSLKNQIMDKLGPENRPYDNED